MNHATSPIDLTILPPFLRLIDVQDLTVENGTAHINFTFDANRHANGIGVAHGGVICTLMDVVMGYSAFSWGDNPGAIVTIDQSVQFASALVGRVRASGRVTRGGRSMIFCAGEIRTESGNLIASGMGTFKRVKRVYEQHAAAALHEESERQRG